MTTLQRLYSNAPFADIPVINFDDEKIPAINTWTGPDGNTYEWDPIGNIVYDIDTGDYLGDKNEFEDYLNRSERVEDWIAPNGKTYKFAPEDVKRAMNDQTLVIERKPTGLQNW